MTFDDFQVLPAEQARELLLQVCSAPRWAAEIADGRPYPSRAAALAVATAALGPADLDAGMAGHPRIGDRVPGGHSAGEQSGVGDDVRAALAAGNRAYEERFGHVYLVCAAGRSGAELLAALHERLTNDPATERAVALAELRKITALRLEKVLA